MAESTNLLSSALAYAHEGLSVLPVLARGKTPLVAEWQKLATSDPAIINKWWTRWPTANVGIHTGKSGIAVVDVDPRNGGELSLNRLKSERGDKWLSHIRVRTGGGGLHYIYAHAGNASLPSVLAPGIDLKRGNGYVLAPPSIHPSGGVYAFDGCSLVDGESAFLPAVPEWFYSQRLTALIESDDWAIHAKPIDPETPENVDRVQSALEFVSADCSRDQWRDVLFAVMSTGWTCAPDICREWSLTAPALFDEDALLNIVESAKDKPNGVTLGSLFFKATANGWQDPRNALHAIESYGDISNGRRFANRYRGRLLFVAAINSWFAWDGQRWAPCSNGEAMASAKSIADECMSETALALKDDPTERSKRNVTQALGVHRNIRRLEAMLQAAASEPGMSIANPGLFDADPWKLGVKNGVLNLRSGELLDARPEMLISRQAGAPFLWDAECPTWQKFLLDAMQGDGLKVAFLQRVCGYALTGLVNEEKLFFMYGTGANGKSVFANAISAAMGEYSVTVRAALLARDPKGNSSDAEREKARLPGSRLALVNETGQSDVWDDQRVKEITSRERISARQLYGESYDFMPTHKLFIRGNHQPGALDGSDGFWRRIVLIGFTRRFEDAERIPDLDRQIIDRELPGVLAWMVDGLQDYQKAGLQIPHSVSSAVDSYRRDTDLLGEWIDSCCRLVAGAEGSLTEMFPSYERFMREANARAPTRNAFGRQLVQRGFSKRRGNGKSLFKGLTLRDPFGGDDL